jgi:HK97 family phage major capsid protein
MMARMHSNWRDGAVWFVNQDVLPALETLQFEVGVGGVPVMLPPGGLSDSPYARLYGKPVIPLEYCATLGTVGDIILANLNAYAVALRGSMDTAYSMHLKFDYAQTAYRVIFEVDGQPWLNSAITPFKGTNTTSPILTLATRA